MRVGRFVTPELAKGGNDMSVSFSTRQEISDRLDQLAESYLRGGRDQRTRREIIELYELLKQLESKESVDIPARVERRRFRVRQSDTAKAIEVVHAKFAELATIHFDAEACRLRLKQAVTADEFFRIVNTEYRQIQRKWDETFHQYLRLSAEAIKSIDLVVCRTTNGRSPWTDNNASTSDRPHTAASG